jgi:hypothetical protein
MDPLDVSRCGNESGCVPESRRSESPSQGLQSAASVAESRAAHAPGISVPRNPEPFAPTQPWHDAPEMVTEMGGGQGHPLNSWREDEPEQFSKSSADRPARLRTVKVLITSDALERLQRLQNQSGLCRTHFTSAALLLGARSLVGQLVQGPVERIGGG